MAQRTDRVGFRYLVLAASILACAFMIMAIFMNIFFIVPGTVMLALIGQSVQTVRLSEKTENIALLHE